VPAVAVVKLLPVWRGMPAGKMSISPISMEIPRKFCLFSETGA
jgi:hypothetical protein